MHGTLRPGRVIEVLDSGKIKAEAPGLFSTEDQDNLPPIYPFFNYHANSFSSVNVGDEVWVLDLSDNPLQLHWLRKDSIDENDSDYFSGKNVEIICNRESGMGWATLYFEDGAGWIMSNINSKIQIRKDGTILLDPGIPHRVVDCCDGSISLGSEGGSSYHGVYSEKLESILKRICKSLDNVREMAGKSAYTVNIETALNMDAPMDIFDTVPEIRSSVVTLD